MVILGLPTISLRREPHHRLRQHFLATLWIIATRPSRLLTILRIEAPMTTSALALGAGIRMAAARSTFIRSPAGGQVATPPQVEATGTELIVFVIFATSSSGSTMSRRRACAVAAAANDEIDELRPRATSGCDYPLPLTVFLLTEADLTAIAHLSARLGDHDEAPSATALTGSCSLRPRPRYRRSPGRDRRRRAESRRR